MIVPLIVIGEGQTEETFSRDILVPWLAQREIMVETRLIPTSKYGAGGALRRERVLRYLRNTLRERNDTYVTTFFDLFRLPADFPGKTEAARIADPMQRATAIEAAFATAAIEVAACRQGRFLPHIQPYEFEALLFSDVGRFGELESPWVNKVVRLQQVRFSAHSRVHQRWRGDSPFCSSCNHLAPAALQQSTSRVTARRGHRTRANSGRVSPFRGLD